MDKEQRHPLVFVIVRFVFCRCPAKTLHVGQRSNRASSDMYIIEPTLIPIEIIAMEILKSGFDPDQLSRFLRKSHHCVKICNDSDEN